ncbi:MAG: hypothetical protein ACOY9J_05240 [Pseudomonadota bacterium]
MIDQTRRDVNLGDLSTIDTAGRGVAEPRVGVDPLDVTRTGQRPVVAPRPGPIAPPRRPPLFVAVLALGGLGLLLVGVVIFLVLQQRELGRGLAVLEVTARNSVATLETRVASTNTTLKSSDSQTQKSLDLIAADIGRLNGNLARLSRQLEQETRTRVGLEGELRSIATELRKADQAGTQTDAQLDTRLKAAAESIDQLAARQATQAEALARLARSGDAAQLRAEVAVLGTTIRDLRDDHGKRLKATEQAVGSSDAFRRQVNATIDRLNQQVAELYQRR